MTIPVICENLNPINQLFWFGEIVFRKLQTSHFPMAAISLVITCKELKIANIAQISLLFKLLNLIWA